MLAPTEPSAPAVCVNCGEPLSRRFCPACGEKRPEPHDLSWKHFCVHAFEAFTHADGKIFRTVRLLVAAPGALTADYLRGRHKPYIAPLPLFLICNLLFFLIQPLIGWNTLTTPLQSHLNEQPYHPWAQKLVEQKLTATHATMSVYQAEFDRSIGTEARALTLVLVPLFFLTLVLISIGRRRSLVDHLIFSLHFCAWFLLSMLAFLALEKAGVVLMGRDYYQAHWQMVDKAGSLVSVIAFAAYLYVATRKVYRDSRVRSLVDACILACAMVPVIWSYRLFLFFIAFLRT